jgi:hypothetical protein
VFFAFGTRCARGEGERVYGKQFFKKNGFLPSELEKPKHALHFASENAFIQKLKQNDFFQLARCMIDP